ncbi:ATP-binding protein [Streptomyces sp. NBC_00638]|uniref:ATP-binding protein n=1 Tax=unclassified Streptomyces TaxID=2593676 RepID=UPI0022564751|nr:ATP-binding protein [Streptomyces sp. NBC_00638]MCX5008599.1 ATP-binding protein [Streptomyces sp. NBC_00638]
MDETSGDVGSAQSHTASPLEASLALDSDGSRIAQARHLAAAFLTKVRDDHGIPVMTATVEIVQLIVSELVTNARKYAPGPALLHLRITGPVLRVELWDSNPALPAAKAQNPRRIGQHGLEIVTALARTVTAEQTPLGKRITADIVLNSATG